MSIRFGCTTIKKCQYRKFHRWPYRLTLNRNPFRDAVVISWLGFNWLVELTKGGSNEHTT